MDQPTKEFLEKEKLKEEIIKIKLERRDINYKWLRWAGAILAPIIVTGIIALVTLNSQLFTDLQIKIDNLRYDFAKDASKLENDKKQLNTQFVALQKDSARIQARVNKLQKDSLQLYAAITDYKRNQPAALLSLNNRIAALGDRIIADSLRCKDAENKMEDSLYRFRRVKPLVVFGREIKQYVEQHHLIEDQKNLIELGRFIDDAVPLSYNYNPTN